MTPELVTQYLTWLQTNPPSPDYLLTGYAVNEYPALEKITITADFSKILQNKRIDS